MSKTVQIVKTADVLHGKPRIEGTRVGVFLLGETVRRNDWSVERAAEEFEVSPEAVRVALDYYDDHPELMDTFRKRREARRRELSGDGEP